MTINYFHAVVTDDIKKILILLQILSRCSYQFCTKVRSKKIQFASEKSALTVEDAMVLPHLPPCKDGRGWRPHIDPPKKNLCFNLALPISG